MPDNIRGIINVKTEGGKILYKVKERSSTESRWIESTSSELSSKHILAFEQKQKERKEAKKGKRSREATDEVAAAASDTETSDLKVGADLDAKDKGGGWYSARIAKLENDRVLIHFIGFSKRQDEAIHEWLRLAFC